MNKLYRKTVYKNGYIGEGVYKTSINNKDTIQYKYWNHMLERCYSDNYLKKRPTYLGCSVCEEWLNFQTFAKWFDANYYECNGERMCLDKDILCKNNKVYSPTTCVFVPTRINVLFTKSNKARGEYPIGVDCHKGKIRARCRIYKDNKSCEKHIGHFDTPEDAFNKGYKPFKEDYIKKVANEYINQIPFKLYEAMYRYVVEIDD